MIDALQRSNKCPFIIKHNLTSKAVGNDITCLPSLLLSKILLVHIGHAHSGLDVTWVSYVLYIDSYKVTCQLME